MSGRGLLEELDRFCERCGVDLGLHGTDDPDEFDCDLAERKADILAGFDRIFGITR